MFYDISSNSAIKKQIAEAKTKIFLNSARFFANISPNFQAIMYTMNFNKVKVIKYSN